MKFIDDRSSIMGTVITPSRKLHGKSAKNVPKITKNCAKMRCFLYIFGIYSLKIFEGGGLALMLNDEILFVHIYL